MAAVASVTPGGAASSSYGGRSAARNAGVKLEAGDLLIFCDDDSIASPDFVECHLNAFAAGSELTVALGWQHGIVSMVEPNLDLPASELLAILKRRPERRRIDVTAPRCWRESRHG